MKILLTCASGMSTSLLRNSILEECKKREGNFEVWEVPAGKLEENIDKADVVLLGPQIRYRLSEFKKLGQKNNTPVEVINSQHYGTMDGKKILEFAIKIKEGFNNDK